MRRFRPEPDAIQDLTVIARDPVLFDRGRLKKAHGLFIVGAGRVFAQDHLTHPAQHTGMLLLDEDLLKSIQGFRVLLLAVQAVCEFQHGFIYDVIKLDLSIRLLEHRRFLFFQLGDLIHALPEHFQDRISVFLTDQNAIFPSAPRNNAAADFPP